jgi:CO/xanthine dehydrogenase FAD-binding subunit
VEGGKLNQARVVLGAIANVPHEVKAANEYLDGKKLDNNVAEKAADIILEKAQPLSDNGYKLLIARTLVRRALMQLVA